MDESLPGSWNTYPPDWGTDGGAGAGQGKRETGVACSFQGGDGVGSPGRPAGSPGPVAKGVGLCVHGAAVPQCSVGPT